jgi:hypothetical protein
MRLYLTISHRSNAQSCKEFTDDWADSIEHWFNIGTLSCATSRPGIAAQWTSKDAERHSSKVEWHLE